ncbi:hypothetical protein A28LD_2028 [Idiomarina sp. A28L]|uniref:hypothetical protein n=1 Tax=Idiomarina sp. A28L TaxID=1036674 RepID=UPI0002138A46|nr:hypothetical protein [Idiomarina sp. A28L]EGN74534.1 hypothetical protein A28LD_2028 [Idiomarina sp. A28L]
MSISKFADRLESLGCKVEAANDSINVDIDDKKIVVTFDDEWLKAVNGFYRAKQYNFDESRRLMTANKSVEYQVLKLDPGFIHRPIYNFSDSTGNKVILKEASPTFTLSYFESKRYEEAFEFIRHRIGRRTESRGRRYSQSRRIPFRVEEIFLRIYTATYTPKRKAKKDNLADIGLKRIRACLFNLAYTKNEVWEIRDDIKSRGFINQRLVDEDVELEIPSANYDPILASYYKVAKSSSFPGQVFLSYYHILEYHFLRVADENMYQAVRAKLNDPAFKATYNNVSKLLSVIKRNDDVGDEKQMLKSVLVKYVPEDEYIEFVKKLEEDANEKLYSSGKQEIFGESFSVKLEQGHALANTSSVLKHIRNSLVHSSDRYTREDCFIPFSKSEVIVCKYLPLVQFMAEKVIFSTAN